MKRSTLFQQIKIINTKIDAVLVKKNLTKKDFSKLDDLLAERYDLCTQLLKSEHYVEPDSDWIN